MYIRHSFFIFYLSCFSQIVDSSGLDLILESGVSHSQIGIKTPIHFIPEVSEYAQGLSCFDEKCHLYLDQQKLAAGLILSSHQWAETADYPVILLTDYSVDKKASHLIHRAFTGQNPVNRSDTDSLPQKLVIPELAFQSKDETLLLVLESEFRWYRVKHVMPFEHLLIKNSIPMEHRKTLYLWQSEGEMHWADSVNVIPHQPFVLMLQEYEGGIRIDSIWMVEPEESGNGGKGTGAGYQEDSSSEAWKSVSHTKKRSSDSSSGATASGGGEPPRRPFSKADQSVPRDAIEVLATDLDKLGINKFPAELGKAKNKIQVERILNTAIEKCNSHRKAHRRDFNYGSKAVVDMIKIIDRSWESFKGGILYSRLQILARPNLR